jgi:hypothetical protein
MQEKVEVLDEAVGLWRDRAHHQQKMRKSSFDLNSL